MYRRSLLRGASPDRGVLAAAARIAAETACDAGRHQQETDSETGNEVCSRCGHVIDDYPDVTAADSTDGTATVSHGQGTQ